MATKTYFYRFQLTRVMAHETRSRRIDQLLLSFGVLLNGRDAGHGGAVAPSFRGTAFDEEGLNNVARGLYHHSKFSAKNMDRAWRIGPVEVRDGDSVRIVATGLNLGNPGAAPARQEDVDAAVMGSLNVFYSVLAGTFVSQLGLGAIPALIGGTGGGAVAGFFANPVAKVLGYEKSGACPGLAFAADRVISARDLNSLPWQPRESRPGVPAHAAVLTSSHTGDEGHDKERCGAVARTDVDVTVWRYDHWSYKERYWSLGSIRERFPEGESLKQLAGVRP